MGFSSKRLNERFILVAIVISALPGAVWSQSGTPFEDPLGKFKITMLGEWRAVSYSDAVGRPKTEFVYRDRSEGLLRITKENLGSGSLESTVRTEEENLRTYRPGFERAATEPFGAGSLQGLRFSFYATEGRRPIASTYYYLRDGDSVWVLRFKGKRGSLDTNRNLTDQVARTFELIK